MLKKYLITSIQYETTVKLISQQGHSHIHQGPVISKTFSWFSSKMSKQCLQTEQVCLTYPRISPVTGDSTTIS